MLHSGIKGDIGRFFTISTFCVLLSLTKISYFECKRRQKYTLGVLHKATLRDTKYSELVSDGSLKAHFARRENKPIPARKLAEAER